jgi:hypothetical protein
VETHLPAAHEIFIAEIKKTAAQSLKKLTITNPSFFDLQYAVRKAALVPRCRLAADGIEKKRGKSPPFSFVTAL